MRRREWMKLAGASTLAAGLGVGRRASAGEVITMATQWPKLSPWGKVFVTWAEAVWQRSGGQLTLDFAYDGAKGDDDDVVGKIKAGSLDGAALGSVGLSKIYKPMASLEMPGLFRSWSKLDKARDAVKADFEKGAKNAGFLLGGFYDVGLVRCLSKRAVKVPHDLRPRKPYHHRGDPHLPAVWGAIGRVSGVPLATPEVRPNLESRTVDTLFTTCLGAEEMQWAGKVDNLTTEIVATAVGGIVFSSKRIDALPTDLRTILTDTCKVAASALTTKIRSEDDAAFARLKGRMTVTSLSADDKDLWRAVFTQARQALAQGTYSSDLVIKLESYAK